MGDGLESLPDDIDALKAALIVARAEAATARARQSDDQALIAHLKLQIEKLNRDRYGPRSERTARLLDQLELTLEDAVVAAMFLSIAICGIVMKNAGIGIGTRIRDQVLADVEARGIGQKPFLPTSARALSLSLRDSMRFNCATFDLAPRIGGAGGLALLVVGDVAIDPLHHLGRQACRQADRLGVIRAQAAVTPAVPGESASRAGDRAGTCSLRLLWRRAAVQNRRGHYRDAVAWFRNLGR
jgi:hypothetical protein